LDNRGGKQRRRRVPLEVLQELFRLRRDRYPDFSVTHFHEHVTERHGLKLSYTFCKRVLQDAGLAERAPGRGKYRRKRERRPLVGMLLHLDASTHAWLSGLPMQDLMVMLDDADGRILHARFVEQEDTLSTLFALSDCWSAMDASPSSTRTVGATLLPPTRLAAESCARRVRCNACCVQ
jgi:hypothetical protein